MRRVFENVGPQKACEVIHEILGKWEVSYIQCSSASYDADTERLILYFRGGSYEITTIDWEGKTRSINAFEPVESFDSILRGLDEISTLDA